MLAPLRLFLVAGSNVGQVVLSANQPREPMSQAADRFTYL